MATSNDMELIAQARQSARSLGVAASWVASRRPVKLADDFIFELYVLFTLIIALQEHYHINYFPGTGDKKDKFPRRPAMKKGRPKFYISDNPDGKLLWQICAGTQIADIYGVARAPDISFQNDKSSDTPCYRDVEIIWDAKYKKNSHNRITNAELSSFGRWIELLKLRKSKKPVIEMSNLQKLAANCLVTNGQESTEPDDERYRLDLKEVTFFYPGNSFQVRP